MREKFSLAKQAIKVGDKKEARRLLVEIVKSNPRNSQAWYMLNFLVTKPEQRIDCLQRVLAIDPNNKVATDLLNSLTDKKKEQEAHLPVQDSTLEHENELPLGEPLDSLDITISEWFSVLSPEERKILEYLYIHNSNFSNPNYEIARTLDMPSYAILRVRDQALRKLSQSAFPTKLLPIFGELSFPGQQETNENHASIASKLVRQCNIQQDEANRLAVLLYDINEQINHLHGLQGGKTQDRDSSYLEEPTNKPSLDMIFEKWFACLSYREQKVLEYHYLHPDQFTVSAVGRIIGEPSRKILQIREKAFEKLFHTKTYDGVEKLIEWFSLVIQTGKTINEQELIAAIENSWSVGKIDPLGVTRLILAFTTEAEKVEGRFLYKLSETHPKITHEFGQIPFNTNDDADAITRTSDSSSGSQNAVKANKVLSFQKNNNLGLEELFLSRRVQNALYRNNIKTIEQLSALSDQKLLSIRGIGETAVAEIHSRLKAYHQDNNLSQELVEETPAKQKKVDTPKKLALPLSMEKRSLRELDLSKRAFNVLMRNNIKTVKKLASLSESDLLGLKNAGQKTVEEIQEKLI